MTSTPLTPAMPRSTRWMLDVVGAGICMGLAAILYFAGIAPLLERYGQFASQQSELDLKKQNATLTSASLASTKRKLATLQQELHDSPLHLQPARLVNNRLARITDVVARHGLIIEDVQPGKSVRGSQFEIVPLHLAGTGSYRSSLRLLHELRNSFPDTAVTSFSLWGDSNNDEQPLHFQFDMEWFASLGDSPAGR